MTRRTAQRGTVVAVPSTLTRHGRVLAAGIALIVAAVAVVTVTRTDPGAAQQPDALAGKVVVWQNEHGKVLAAAPDVRDKRSLRPVGTKPVDTDRMMAASGAEAAAETGDGGYPDRETWLYPVQSTSVSPQGGTGAAIEAAGGSNVVLPFLEYYATYTQSSSRVTWFGSAPFNADSVEHTDRWHVDFVGTGYNVYGTPPGAEVTTGPSSAEVRWTTSVEDNWYSEHTWDWLAFYPEDPPLFGQVYRFGHEVTGVFQFGSSFYTVTGQAKTFT